MTDHDNHFDVGRRTVLKTAAIAGIGASGFAATTTPVAAGSSELVVDADGGGDHESIQAAVDAASPGEVIAVRPGSYDEQVTVNTPEVTVAGASPPEDDPATVDGWIEVTAPGVTVRQLRVTSSTTYDSTNWSRPGSPFGILVTAAGVRVEGNLVESIHAVAGVGGSSISVNGIQLFNGGGTPLAGLDVVNNTVRDIFNDGQPAAGWPDFGGVAAIKVQGVLDGVEVRRNEVTELHSAGWVWGIVNTHTGNAPSVSPKNVAVERNRVSRGNDGTEFDVFKQPADVPYPGVAFGIDGNSRADAATVRYNDFVKIPGGVQNKDTDHDLQAPVNWWGSKRGPAHPADIGHGNRSAIIGPGITDPSPWLTNKVKDTLRFPIVEEFFLHEDRLQWQDGRDQIKLKLERVSDEWRFRGRAQSRSAQLQVKERFSDGETFIAILHRFVDESPVGATGAVITDWVKQFGINETFA